MESGVRQRRSGLWSVLAVSLVASVLGVLAPSSSSPAAAAGIDAHYIYEGLNNAPFVCPGDVIDVDIWHDESYRENIQWFRTWVPADARVEVTQQVTLTNISTTSNQLHYLYHQDLTLGHDERYETSRSGIPPGTNTIELTFNYPKSGVAEYSNDHDVILGMRHQGNSHGADGTATIEYVGGAGTPAQLNAQCLYERYSWGLRNQAEHAADPVDVASGNLIEARTDVRPRPGTNGPSVLRQYNSTDESVGMFGSGWRTPYETVVQRMTEDRDYSGSGPVSFDPPDESRLHYRDPAGVVQFVDWDSVDGWDDLMGAVEISYDATDEEYDLTRTGSGEVWSYDLDTGRLVEVVHPDGEVLTFTWGNDPSAAGNDVLYASSSLDSDTTFRWLEHASIPDVVGEVWVDTPAATEDDPTINYFYETDSSRDLPVLTAVSIAHFDSSLGADPWSVGEECRGDYPCERYESNDPRIPGESEDPWMTRAIDASGRELFYNHLTWSPQTVSVPNAATGSWWMETFPVETLELDVDVSAATVAGTFTVEVDENHTITGDWNEPANDGGAPDDVLDDLEDMLAAIVPGTTVTGTAATTTTDGSYTIVWGDSGGHDVVIVDSVTDADVTDSYDATARRAHTIEVTGAAAAVSGDTFDLEIDSLGTSTFDWNESVASIQTELDSKVSGTTVEGVPATTATEGAYVILWGDSASHVVTTNDSGLNGNATLADNEDLDADATADQVNDYLELVEPGSTATALAFSGVTSYAIEWPTVDSYVGFEVFDDFPSHTATAGVTFASPLSGQVRVQELPSGDTATFAYDLQSTFTYGPADSLTAEFDTTVTFDDGTSAETFRYHYDEDYQIVGITDPTASGNSIERTWTDGQLDTFEDRDGNDWDYEYNQDDQISRRTGPDPDGAGPLVGLVEDYEYDAEGRLYIHAVGDPADTSYEGLITTYTYANSTDRVPEKVYQCENADHDSPANTANHPDPCPAGTPFVETELNTDGLATTVIDPDWDATAANSDGPKLEYTYGLSTATISEDMISGSDTYCELDTQRCEEKINGTVVAQYTYNEVNGQIASYSVPDPNNSGSLLTTEYYYDASGRPIAIYDPEAHHQAGGTQTRWPTETVYDGVGRVQHVSGPNNSTAAASLTSANSTVSITYNDAGRVETSSSLIDGTTRSVTKYRYDGAGQLTSITVADDGDNDIGSAETSTIEATTFYTYGDLGRLESTQDPTGVKTFFCYDEAGRETRQIVGETGAYNSTWCGASPPGSLVYSETTYDELGRVTSTTSAEGRVVETEYTQMGDIGEVTETWDDTGSVDLRMTGWTYDYAGRVTENLQSLQGGWTTNGAGDREPTHYEVVETRTYTDGGRVLEVNNPTPSQWASVFASSPTWVTTDYAYDDQGRLETITDPEGIETEWDYDVLGRVTTTTQGAQATGGGRDTDFYYDRLGQLATILQPDPSSGAIPGDMVQRVYTYNNFGAVASETEWHDYATVGTVPSGTPERSFEFNDAGWMVNATDMLGQDVLSTYNENGLRTTRRSSQTAGVDPTTSCTPGGVTCLQDTWDYDLAGRLTSYTDPADNEWQWFYDSALGYLTEYRRPGTPNGANTEHVVERYFYNDDAQTTAVDYLTGIYNSTGVLQSYDYAEQVTWSYNDAGFATTGKLNECTGSCTTSSPTWSTVNAVKYSYGQTREPQSVTTSFDGGIGGTDDRSMTYNYDASNMPMRFIDPNGASWRYIHDDAGRLEQSSLRVEVCDPNCTNVWVPMATYTYNDFSEPATELVVEPQDANGDPAIVHRTYSYNDAGMRAGYVECWDWNTGTSSCGIGNPRTEGTTYLPNGRLATHSIEEDSRRTYAYDDAGQITDVSRADWSLNTYGTDYGVIDYTYNGQGSRLLETHYDSSGTEDFRYSYDYETTAAMDDIDIQNWTGAAWGTAAQCADLSHNETGQRTEVDYNTTNCSDFDDLLSFTWDARGWMSNLNIDPDEQTASDDVDYGRERNAVGHLIQYTLGSDEVELIWDDINHAIPNIVWVEFPLWGNEVEWRDNYGIKPIGAHLEVGGTSAWQWYGYNIFDDTIDSPTRTGPADYDPFGNPSWHQASDEGEMFGGYRTEWHFNDLIHLRARDYDPTTGQFLDRDPLEGQAAHTTTANPYHYVDNDPTNLVDPLGLRPQDSAFENLTPDQRANQVCSELRLSYYEIYERDGQIFVNCFEVGSASNDGGLRGVVHGIGDVALAPGNAAVALGQGLGNGDFARGLAVVRDNPGALADVTIRPVADAVYDCGNWNSTARERTSGCIDTALTAFGAGRTGTQIQSNVRARGGLTGDRGAIGGSADSGPSGALDDSLAEARIQRNDLADEMGSNGPGAFTGAVDTNNPNSFVAACSGGGRCAEPNAVDALGIDPADAQFTHAYGYRQGEYVEIPVCVICQGSYSPSQFPESVLFDRGGPWSE